MYGAIIGDLAGSIYEYEQTKGIKEIRLEQIIDEKSFYSDDTILTVSIADAILHDRNYDYYLRKYVKQYVSYHPDYAPYFKTAFSPGIIKWSNGDVIGTSIGNGAIMRISPVGFMFDTESEVVLNARLATIPSHCSEEAIISATKIALIIFYLRQGLSMKEVYHKLDIILKYTPFSHFNTTCEETLDNCLYVLYHSFSFEDAIKKAIFMGGDTDTNACIVGSMAEAFYGIDENLIEEANQKLPDDFIKILSRVRKV